MTVGWSAHQHDADQQPRHAQVYDKNSFKGEELIGAATWFLPPPNAPPWKVVRVRLHPPSGGGLAGSAGEVVFSAQRVRVEVRMACCNSGWLTCSCSAVEECCDLHSACALRRARPISFLSTVMLARLPSLLSKALQMLHCPQLLPSCKHFASEENMSPTQSATGLLARAGGSRRQVLKLLKRVSAHYS